MSSYKPVTAALRVLEVLAAVNRLDGRATVGTIYQQLEIDKSTIVRMLETLISAGYIVKSTETASYAVTGKTLMLSASFDQHKAFGNIIAPLLKEFRDEIGWPSDVALFDHDAMLVIESSRAAGPLSFNRAPGYRAPVLGTSLGIAYLAHSAAEHQEQVRQAVQDDGAPWNEVAQNKDAFIELLQKVRDEGFAAMPPSYSMQEYNNRISTLGVPILAKGQVLASINVIYLKQAVSPDQAEETLLPPLKAVAHKMGQALSKSLG